MAESAVLGLRGTVATTGGGGAGNPLVVGPQDTTTPFSGLRLIEDGHMLSQAIQNKDWVSGGLATVAGVADAVAFAMNPLAGLVSMGVGWLLDHIEPLKSWLNELTGDAGAVAGAAGTWSNIGQSLHSTAGDYGSAVKTTVAGTNGMTIQAYSALAADITSHLKMVGSLAEAVSTGLQIASSIVQIVHDLVRDAISDVVGYAVSCIIPLPTVISSVLAKVAAWEAKLGSKLAALRTSVRQFGAKLRNVDELMDAVTTAFAAVARGSSPLVPGPAAIPTPHRAPTAPVRPVAPSPGAATPSGTPGFTQNSRGQRVPVDGNGRPIQVNGRDVFQARNGALFYTGANPPRMVRYRDYPTEVAPPTSRKVDVYAQRGSLQDGPGYDGTAYQNATDLHRTQVDTTEDLLSQLGVTRSQLDGPDTPAMTEARNAAELAGDADRVDLLDDLNDAWLAEQRSRVDLISTAEHAGVDASLASHADSGLTTVIGSHPGDVSPGAGRLDTVGVGQNADGSWTTVIDEAKARQLGGSPDLGARNMPDGIRAQQGTTPYLNDLMHADPRFSERLAEFAQGNPGFREAWNNGDVSITYRLVVARPDGSSGIATFILDASDLRLPPLN